MYKDTLLLVTASLFLSHVGRDDGGRKALRPYERVSQTRPSTATRTRAVLAGPALRDIARTR